VVCSIYELYADYVLKNPFYEVSRPSPAPTVHVCLSQSLMTLHLT
jgi:hypothetical protein